MAGRNLEGQYAGFLSRVLGLVFDYVIIVAVVAAMGLLTGLLFDAFRIDLATCSTSTSVTGLTASACLAVRSILAILALLFGPLYYIFFWMLTGQTIGQRIMGLQVVRLNGRRLGFWLSLVRWIGYQICIITLGIGFAWVLVDNRRMGWHDKLARTCVVYAWPAEQNEDFIARMNRRFGRRKASPVQIEPSVSQEAPAPQEQVAG